MRPEVKYASSGDVSIAYTVSGDAPLDLVIVPGFISHLEVMLENPRIARLSEIGRAHV